MWLTSPSSASLGIGRLAQATRIPFESFSRSNGSRRPSPFTTSGVVTIARSTVEKRFPHALHSRRRRMAPLLSCRGSMTLVSVSPQYGHFTSRLEAGNVLLSDHVSHGPRRHGLHIYGKWVPHDPNI